MKFSAIIVSGLAAAVTAAPVNEARGNVDSSAFNNFAFNSLDLGYLNAINSVNLGALQQLAAVNNFNLGGFQSLFNNNVFDVNALLQLQQIQMLAQLQQIGVLGGFDLGTLQLNNLNFGLINNIGSLNLGQFIDASLVPQIQTIVQQSVQVIGK